MPLVALCKWALFAAIIWRRPPNDNEEAFMVKAPLKRFPRRYKPRRE
jgi:hypothetical protein